MAGWEHRERLFLLERSRFLWLGLAMEVTVAALTAYLSGRFIFPGLFFFYIFF